MSVNHFLKLLDFTPAEIQHFLDVAADLKAKKKAGIPHRMLEGKNIALIFSFMACPQFRVALLTLS